MGAHPNVHVPRESWPNWTWYAIEFGIVIAVSMLVSREITNSFEGLAPDIQNWVFMGIVGVIFFIWYVVIRRLVLKRKFLENKY